MQHNTCRLVDGVHNLVLLHMIHALVADFARMNQYREKQEGTSTLSNFIHVEYAAHFPDALQTTPAALPMLEMSSNSPLKITLDGY